MAELADVLRQVVERLTALARSDAELRAQLRALAEAVLAETEPPTPVRERSAPESVRAAEPSRPAAIDPAALGLEIGSKAPKPAVGPGVSKYLSAREDGPPAARADVSDAELPLIASRCRLKAEGARWAAKRRQMLDAGADYGLEVAPLDRQIIDKAKDLPDCFLWMNHPDGPSPSDAAMMAQLAGCFDNLADAVATVRTLLNDSATNADDLEEALLLLSEAQSALRGAVTDVDDRQDRDQLQAYNWLRATAYNRQIYINRYMKLSDPADPAAWGDLAARIEALDERVNADRQLSRNRQKGLKRIDFHLDRMQKSPAEDRSHDWRVVVDTLEELIQDGLPENHAELRRMLLPVVDDLPEFALPPGVERVVREIDRYLATRPPSAVAAAAPVATPEVTRAAQLLRGRTLVLIGGERRPHNVAALVEAFGLAELDWIATREHESISTFEPHVARPEVAAVLLAIRWSSHSFGDVKQFCDRHDKPLIRLPAGYSPNQVAVQLLQQAGDKLRSTVNSPA